MTVLLKGRIWISAGIKRNGVGVGVWVSQLVDSLPELPNADYPAGALIEVRNTEEKQVYRGLEGRWERVDISA